MNKVGVIGAGAWGTALACAMQRAGNEVLLQAYEPEVAEAINRSHANPIYLPNTNLNPNIRATSDLTDIIGSDVILIGCPGPACARNLSGLAPDLEKRHAFVDLCQRD